MPLRGISAFTRPGKPGPPSAGGGLIFFANAIVFCIGALNGARVTLFRKVSYCLTKVKQYFAFRHTSHVTYSFGRSRKEYVLFNTIHAVKSPVLKITLRKAFKITRIARHNVIVF